MAEFALRTLQRVNLNRLVPIVGAIAGGVIAAAGVMLSSGDALEALVSDTGIAALIPMAAPPLGATARAILALGAGALVAAILWSLSVSAVRAGWGVRRSTSARGRRADNPPRRRTSRRTAAQADVGS
ncbi:hypothetical protein NHF48_010705 [Sphingomonas sp. H160509]|uniref:hypothetical protein n=1 Tax=Sphingomonas sp. H160509 TaxID=2955313 RepID=UPI00209846A5|nr:hypothetical protein [Sphingomonas sp. H160509]MDD1451328.1 hypothetical protein [Sphingomonas sp. H160509]